ncbi:MAG TPA: RNase adapter RapZ [Acidimicrobiia bacterium]|nr:RNase adapter RapZ [Acidimicrobiia bacterium]
MAERPQLVVITGMSGAGRSLAGKALEDLGFFVIDNLPANLIARVVEQADPAGDPRRRRLAVAVDTRGGLSFEALEEVLLTLAREGVPTTLLFLDADDEVLTKRFSESRRPHPVVAPTLSESIALERAALQDLRGEADVVVDTSDRSVHELRQLLQELFAGERPRRPLRVSVTSFGFKHGVPRVVDLVFDVRFLPNPFWVPELRPLTGHDEAVRRMVMSDPDTGEFLRRTEALLEFLLPRYEAEGKSYLTIGVGCTGGRHRAVVVAEELGRWLAEREVEVSVRHRDTER